MIKAILLSSFCYPVLASNCHICGVAGNQNLKYPSGYITEDKKTCAEITIDIFRKKLSTRACSKYIRKYRKCCDGSRLPSKPKADPINNMNVIYEGPHPKCDLCYAGAFPADPSHVINLLYVGQGSCREYYSAGRKGKIPAYLCDPLRYFSQRPCACPRYYTTKTRSINEKRNYQIISGTLVVGCFVVLLLLLVGLCAKYN